MVKSEAERKSVFPAVRSAASPRFRVQQVFSGVTRTKEAHADECDINKIMARYRSTGILPGMERLAGAQYIDCRAVDYQQAMLLVASAKSAFLDMPARIRDRFGNDPAELMRFLEDKRNLEEARELGLVRPEEVEATPLAVRVVEPVSGDPSKTLSRIEAGDAGATRPVEAKPK